MQNIITVTLNPALDISTSIAKVAVNRKLRCDPSETHPGGGGINISRVVKRFGGESVAVYFSGGRQGESLQQLIEAEGIRQVPVPVSGDTRESLTISEQVSGNQYRFVLPGPSLRKTEALSILDVLTGLTPCPAFLVGSGSLPPGMEDDFWAKVGDVCRRRGSRFILDTSGEALRRGLGKGVFLLKPNLHELGQLSGRGIEGEDEQEEAAHKLIDSGKCQIVVLSRGAGGALLVSAEKKVRFRVPSVPVKSRVGAGDSMLAGMVYMLSRKEPLEEVVRFGVAAGAAAVMTPGTELCRREDTLKIYENLKQEAGEGEP